MLTEDGKYTKEYFIEEWNSFREVMTSRKYNEDQVHNAHKALLTITTQCEDPTFAAYWFRVVTEEMTMRFGLIYSTFINEEDYHV